MTKSHKLFIDNERLSNIVIWHRKKNTKSNYGNNRNTRIMFFLIWNRHCFSKSSGISALKRFNSSESQESTGLRFLVEISENDLSSILAPFSALKMISIHFSSYFILSHIIFGNFDQKSNSRFFMRIFGKVSNQSIPETSEIPLGFENSVKKHPVTRFQNSL